ncbi:MAG: glutathione S-transferase family protein [Alphaproteobacteria bacterium]|nr:MAG: glutathione S-transferase family protein [Alphaproteobacteria bacterium]
MLTLYFSPGSSSMATHIALNEIGVPFEAKLTALHEHKNRAPDYLAVNPEGKVPTLMIDGRPLTEVAATLWYLARRYPEANLLPQYGDIEGEARVISWMSFIASTIHPARRTGDERWREVFVLANQRLGPSEWTVDRYSIADIHLFRLYWRFVDTLHPAPGAYPNLSGHYDRMMARPAVQKTLKAEAAIGYNLPR